MPRNPTRTPRDSTPHDCTSGTGTFGNSTSGHHAAAPAPADARPGRRFRRLAGVLALSAGAMAGGLGVLQPTAAVAATPGAVTAWQQYGYPYPNASDCNEKNASDGSCVADRWGFYQGQCVSWVAWRLNSLSGVPMANAPTVPGYLGQHWGSASRWGTVAQSIGIPVDNTPAVGAVAWYRTHVAYVEQVNPDGSVVISEMNHDDHNRFDLATISPTYRWPQGFIHFKDLHAQAPDKVSGGVQYATDRNGTLYDVSLPAAGGAATRRPVSTGWRTRSLLTQVSDLNGDGWPELVSRAPSGSLWLRLSTGRDRFAAPRRLGTRWGDVTSLVDAGALTGSGHQLVSRSRTGRVVRWSITTAGLSHPRVLMSTSPWLSVTGVGDVTRSGHTDLLARTRDGSLVLYVGTSTGLSAGTTVGTAAAGLLSSPSAGRLLGVRPTAATSQVILPGEVLPVSTVTGLQGLTLA